MAIKNLVQAQSLNSTVTEVYTPPALTRARIDVASVYNPSGSAASTVELFIDASGDTPAAVNRICRQSVGIQTAVDLSPAAGHVIEPGQALFAAASWTGTGLHVSGIEELITNVE